MKRTQSSKIAAKVSPELPTHPLEEQAINDILLLLDQLVQQESTTVKLILDRLYDIGSINLINRKVKPRSVNRISKAISSQTKPIFLFFGIRWFRRNCPQLITDWLYEQVKFQPITAAQEIIETNSLPNSPSDPDLYGLELRKMRTQLKWRTGLLGGSIGVLSAVLVFNTMGLFSNPSVTSLPASPPTAQQFNSSN
ncbi:hypothetical protein HRE53_29900 (plasmid) [Acaryochloris sp. 'Moss Beach']|uniref:hypothetical protein n=1 Tax=Acaryochloris sp. 'Moss Beach' TaxID=2740837 RepID=UPI001F1A4360|nr:hypothetical protein [Acaryochloris sp. 'Moss Beach']UJB72812.1 hypothetical protein HRE53_29900 [Acaryochloris sp. 'Moss Beach']